MSILLSREYSIKVARPDLFPEVWHPILELIVQGIFNRKEIAQKIQKSVHTVRIQIYGNSFEGMSDTTSNLGIFGVVTRETGIEITTMSQLLIVCLEHGIFKQVIGKHHRQ